MIKSKELLYMGCTQVGHDDYGLTRVCVDAKCNTRQLICPKCIEEPTHLNHRNMLLSDFIQKTSELCYKKPGERQFNDRVLRLKNLKEKSVESIVEFRCKVEDLLMVLEKSLRHFQSMDTDLPAPAQFKPSEFVYNPSLGVRKINEQLVYATTVYCNLVDDKILKALDYKIETRQLQTKRMLQWIGATSKQIDNFPSLGSLEVRAKWSTLFKHADIDITGTSTVTRTSNSNSSRSICALADTPLSASASWRMRIVQVSKRVGVGILNRSVAKIFGFTKRAMDLEQIPNLAVILSDGTRQGEVKVKRGQCFSFEQGDVIQMQFDITKMELILTKGPNCTCVLEVKSLLDPSDRYYPCAFLRNLKDSVEMLQ